MSAPFLKKSKDGFLVRLHRAFYARVAVETLKSGGYDVDVAVKGAYWQLLFKGVDEMQVLEALGQLFLLSKGQRS